VDEITLPYQVSNLNANQVGIHMSAQNSKYLTVMPSVNTNPASLSLNGSTQYATGTIVNLSNTNSTISFWIRLNNTNNQTPVLQGDVEGAGKVYLIQLLYGTTIRFSVYQSDLDYVIPGGIPVNIWFHVCCNYNISTRNAQIFYNGLPVVNVQMTYTLNTGTNTIYISRRGGEYVNGYMHDLCIYSDTLSTSEVATIYNGGISVDHKQLSSANKIIAYYQFQNLNGSTIRNSVSTSYSLTTVNGPTTSTTVLPRYTTAINKFAKSIYYDMSKLEMGMINWAPTTSFSVSMWVNIPIDRKSVV
jgi:hypothetical protein